MYLVKRAISNNRLEWELVFQARFTVLVGCDGICSAKCVCARVCVPMRACVRAWVCLNQGFSEAVRNNTSEQSGFMTGLILKHFLVVSHSEMFYFCPHFSLPTHSQKAHLWVRTNIQWLIDKKKNWSL